ncbi:hypothetical protein [Methanothrix sp.]|uniref:hypothetical protein n=1 Tax=Methanothrix sp. TaxID=90426 RepID=UPI0025EB8D17|nr:hypothetical protein [Methanothrix sp.]
MLALLLIFLIFSGQIDMASALSGKVQEGEFTNGLRVAGTGYFEVGVSIKDRDLALEYNSFMTGDGDLEMDTGTVESQRAGRLPGMGNSSLIPLNLWESSRISYFGTTPMVGTKHIHSKSFWGGIGAQVQESFSVTEMERGRKHILRLRRSLLRRRRSGEDRRIAQSKACGFSGHSDQELIQWDLADRCPSAQAALQGCQGT